MDLGPHAAFIVIAYAIVALVVVMMVGWIAADYRRQQAALQRLDAEGVTRRSVRPREEPRH